MKNVNILKPPVSEPVNILAQIFGSQNFFWGGRLYCAPVQDERSTPFFANRGNSCGHGFLDGRQFGKVMRLMEESGSGKSTVVLRGKSGLQKAPKSKKRGEVGAQGFLWRAEAPQVRKRRILHEARSECGARPWFALPQYSYSSWTLPSDLRKGGTRPTNSSSMISS